MGTLQGWREGQESERSGASEGEVGSEASTGSVVLTLAACENDLKNFKNFPGVQAPPPRDCDLIGLGWGLDMGNL